MSLTQPVCNAQAQDNSRDSDLSSNDSSSSEGKETLNPDCLHVGETNGTRDASEQYVTPFAVSLV